jgi:type IV secretory pathway VirJ component
MAHDTQAIAGPYATAWHRERLVLVGYSRGADVAPFVVNRWSDDLRRRLALVALVGLADHASFEFHWKDILYDVRRQSDRPTRPELERIRGARILCVYGRGESDSLCPSLDPATVHQARHPGGHVLDATSGAAVAELVANALR